MRLSSVFNTAFKTTSQHPPHSLRNVINFPTFSALPREPILNPFHLGLYLKDTTSLSLKRARHWCFLGEIIEVILHQSADNFLRVSDKEGVTFPIAVEVVEQDMAFTEACKPGRTVAMLNPWLQQFSVGHRGIRVYDADVEQRRIKIHPFGLQTLLKANDMALQMQSVDYKCTHCGKHDERPVYCTQCSTMHCSKVSYISSKPKWAIANCNIYCRDLKTVIASRSMRNSAYR